MHRMSARILKTVTVFVITAFVFCAAKPVAQAEGPADVMDVGSLSLFGKTLNPNFTLSYLDNEGNTPQTGVVRSETEIQEDPKNPSVAIMEMRFTEPADWRNYVGWYISRPTGTDLSDKTFFQFELKVDPDIPLENIQLGIRSLNLNANKNRAKVYLSELGMRQLPRGFVKIRVPVSLLLKKEPDLDLRRVNELFILAIVSPAVDIVNKPIWIRSVRWDWGLEEEGGKLKADLSSAILFDFDKYDLRPEALQYLQKLGKMLAPFRDRVITINGHTDNIGSWQYNKKLSERRAQSVANDLVKIGALDASKVRIEGFSFDKPVVSNETDAGRSRNRRVEVLIPKDNSTQSKARTAETAGTEITKAGGASEDLLPEVAANSK